MPLPITRLLTAGVAGVLVAAGATVPAVAAPSADRTSTAESRRVDRVKTPKLGWYKCYDYAECATVRLPLDYDRPDGPTTEIAVLRVKARDQKNRIGSLFVNPGGPGGSATSMALAAPYFLGSALLDRFDVVGVDPRGIGASANVRCFRSHQEQTEAYEGLNVTFPYGAAEEKAYIAATERVGRACSTTGKPLTGAMSTAEVARDMDVVRRAVGDRKLTYLGFSYGSALGQYYANMFPDRFRALVVDGVLDPVAWTGIRAGNRILDDRLRSSDGAYRALAEILKRCDAVGEQRCAFAAGDPRANFAAIAEELKAEPLEFTDPAGTYRITYADFVGGVLGALYAPDAGDYVTQLLAEIRALLDDRDSTSARAALVRRINQAKARAFDFPYENGFEATSGVICTDGLFPRDTERWRAATAAADRRAPYFGRAWGWIDAPCARDTWTVRDEDAYRGPFNRRTQAPVLFVGNLWDPATNYDASVSSSRRLPGSGLLSSNNWGHTAYGTSPCADSAIESYLLTGALPAVSRCTDGPQPFAEPLPGGDAARTMKTGKERPPVATPLPISVLNGNR
jgi:pimeloyl-ACP methyl ester carboxylesterase